MKTLILLCALAAATVLGACTESTPTRPTGAAPIDPTTLIGMRAQSLDAELARQGFVNKGGYKTDEASMTTWYNPASRQCISVETRQGKIGDARSIVEGNCL